MKKIVVGMSGGVDSSVSLMLLKKQGYSPVGVSLKLPVWKNKDNQLCENSCCTKESLDLAKSVCEKLDVPYYVYDTQLNFKKKVIDYFVSEFKNEKTPNPCAVCNRYHKFAKLFEFAKRNGIRYVATGHYAKIKTDDLGNTYLMRPKDKSKDQTYGLCLLSKKQLSNIVFPLGDLLKKEVFEIAQQEGFDVFLKKKESQNFCFVSNKALSSFLRLEVGVNKGKIYDDSQKIIGEHDGSHFFTIGQRKGLGFSKKYFVLDKKNNNVVVTDDEKKLFSNNFLVKDCNFLTDDFFKKKEYLIKTRYSQTMVKGEVSKKGSLIEVVLKTPQKSITPGQICVFYDDVVCVGGGFIV
jgi:tRNA-uridine 2-sulfurtransferase